MRSETRQLVVRTPVPLIEDARRACPEARTVADLVRAGLAALAGVEPDRYTVRGGQETREERAARLARESAELVPTP